MKIRLARSADAKAISVLLDQLGYPQDNVEPTAARVKAWADDPSGAVYVADDGGILGVIAVYVSPFFEHDGARGRIVALVVSEQARGKGIGSLLVKQAEAFARSHGCQQMEVTSAHHRRAGGTHKFYIERGYDDQVTTSAYFRKNLTA